MYYVICVLKCDSGLDLSFSDLKKKLSIYVLTTSLFLLILIIQYITLILAIVNMLMKELLISTSRSQKIFSVF